MFAAIVNTPGYLPDSDEGPAVFNTARDAWEYLADERKQGEDAYDAAGYSDTYATLRLMATGIPNVWQSVGLDSDGCGTVYGNTPGYDGSHDLGVAYSVDIATDEHADDCGCDGLT
jgi:hypothetical protein